MSNLFIVETTAQLSNNMYYYDNFISLVISDDNGVFTKKGLISEDKKIKGITHIPFNPEYKEIGYSLIVPVKQDKNIMLARFFKLHRIYRLPSNEVTTVFNRLKATYNNTFIKLLSGCEFLIESKNITFSIHKSRYNDDLFIVNKSLI